MAASHLASSVSPSPNNYARVESQGRAIDHEPSVPAFAPAARAPFVL